MLDLLGLIRVADLHLVRPHSLIFFLKTLLLISEDFECHDDLFDLVLALLQHLLHLTIVVVKALTFISTILLISSSLFDLPVFDLDQLSQVLVLLLQSLVL